MFFFILLRTVLSGVRWYAGEFDAVVFLCGCVRYCYVSGVYKWQIMKKIQNVKTDTQGEHNIVA
jgi:hypothetical protein